jgi:hypothetical protein
MKPICAFIIIMAWLLLCGFGGSGMSGKTGIRNGGDFNAVDKAQTSEAAPAGSYLLAEDSSNITDESGNKLITE